MSDCDNGAAKIVVDGVLGLAPCHHSGKLQVRLTDQVRYHQHSSSVFVGAGLDGLLAPPAFDSNWKNDMKSKTKKLKIMKTAAEHRSFTFFQMVHTHASLPRGFSFFFFPASGCSYRCPDHG